MNTTFSLRISGADECTARSVSMECFEHLDLLESRLSRFIEGSDVWRINTMSAGETLYISEACHQCLLLAVDAHVRTGGLFDITLGNRIEHMKSGLGGPPPALTGKLTIHPDAPAVTCDEPGRVLDLGGIGKGFALDELRRILHEWDIPDALISAGASSHLAMGPGSWPVELAGDHGKMLIHLSGQSLSASGTGIQGSHILHPGGADAMPGVSPRRIWVTADSATLAEIWSTALMLVPFEEIPGFIAGSGGIAAVHADWNDRVVVVC